ncbi:MAG: glutamate--tRNA ligase, partial [Patescibacteria group bacterium]|nr:glutamate--tRNA ligase [Patescibacteria group bacterium]
MVRTRIAPSPTGPLHVGNARTALFNWLYARQHGGVFVVRVEDTDVARSDPRWERDALENFAWLGLNWDEGPILSSGQDWAPSEIGDYGPYRQSRRKDIYRKYLEELIEEGHVYECFCAVEELEAMRSAQLARGEAPRYVGRCRELGAADVAERRGRGAAAVLRFKVPAKKIVIDDLVRGKVEFDAALLGDIVIAKHLDYALYNFAAVIDDFTMEISHVIRGEDHLSNTPKQILFQEALQFPRPVYAHIPLLLGADRTKLSKRHGATAVTEYRTEGYLPEA